MYNVTQGFLNAIKAANRQFQTSVTVRNIIFGDVKIADFSLEESVNPGDSFMLGAVASSKFEISLLDVPNTLILEGATVTPKIGLLVGTSYEEVPLGVFIVDEISKDKNKVKLTCYDNMIKLEKAYFSNLTYPASINSVAQEICSKAGVQLASTLPSTPIYKIEGYTYREAISFIASFLGGFSRFNRAGKLEITTYSASNITVTADNYFKNPTTAEKVFSIGRIACQVGENILSVGSSGNEAQFVNPIMTQSQLNYIYNTLKALTYMPFNMDWQGNPALMAGDKISITDINGITYNTIIMQQKLDYKGGLSATAIAIGKTEQAQEFNSGGSINKKVDRVVTEQANIKILLAEKATIQDLIAVNARIEHISADYATIDNLFAATARIGLLEANSATITQLNAEKARIDILLANSATITQLNATTAIVNTLEAKTASIENILAGNIDADNISVELLTVIKGWMLEGSIGNAQISSLNAGKLTAGTVDTSKVTIQGTNARLKITGNRLQVFAGTTSLYERVSLGDVNGNDSVYGFRVRGADGTTILIDETGVKREGITDGSITNAKIAGDASISGTKLDIASVVTSINGGTTTIQGNKIFVDGKTLDVSFSTLKNTVTSQGETISSHSTSISSMDGAIKLKVDTQTYVNDKTTIEQRLTTTESSITTMQGEISLKASSTELESLNTDIGQFKEEYAVAINNHQAQINIFSEFINSTVTETYVSKDELEQYKQVVSSSINQTSSDLVIAFRKADSRIENVENEANNFKDIVESSITFNEDGITIGKNDSPFKTVTSNSQLSFTENGEVVAYINNNTMNITNAEVENSLTLGGFKFEPRVNGNLSLVWKG